MTIGWASPPKGIATSRISCSITPPLSLRFLSSRGRVDCPRGRRATCPASEQRPPASLPTCLPRPTRRWRSRPTPHTADRQPRYPSSFQPLLAPSVVQEPLRQLSITLPPRSVA